LIRREYTVTELDTAAKSTTNSLRPTTLLLAAALGLAAVGAHTMPQGQNRWVTLAAADGAAIYTASTSETACRAAQADAAVICLSGNDMRQVRDEQVVAQATISAR
jgi:hypothetical protein